MLFNIVIYLGIFGILVLLSVWDIRYRLVPPAGWIAIMVLGAVATIGDWAVFSGLKAMEFTGGTGKATEFTGAAGKAVELLLKINSSYGFHNPMIHIKGLIIIFAISFLLALLTKGLGGGDIKLLSSLGFAVGLEEGLKILVFSFLLSGIFIAAFMLMRLLGRVIPRFSMITGFSELPFVPFITLSFILIFIENLLY